MRAAAHVSSWVEWLARLGYAAKGVVYITVGLIAAQAALGSGSQATGSEGALAVILRQPLGQILLVAVAIGLVGYGLWRIVAAALDPEDKGSDAKGIAVRIGFAISGLIHLGLALEAARLILGSGGGGDGDREAADHWTAVLVRQPFGVWLATAVGVGIAAFGLYQLYKAFAAELDRQLNLSSMGNRARVWTIRFARCGLAARGVVFGVIGAMLVQAALQYDPADAVGLGGALGTLQRQPYGPWLLGGVAVGLIGYGIYELVKAQYREIRPG